MRWGGLLSCVLAVAFGAACGDGIGVPIRRAATESDSGMNTAGDSGDDDDGPDGDRDAFDEAHCAETADWPEELAHAEDELFGMIDRLRDRGLRCGDREFDELSPLEPSRALRCSARLHSLDMVRRDFTGRTNPDGDDPDERMEAAGFHVERSSESIAAHEADSLQALEQLLSDWDDCLNVATRELTHIGIGRYGELWTLDFARD